MKVIGLCGGSGSGKSTISSFFATHNILPINTDEIYRNITSHRTECINELERAFGTEIINSDGSLNRKKLAPIVYADTEKQRILNGIAHYHVLNEVRLIIKEAEKKEYFAVLVDAPLLYESGFDKECDATVAVVADFEKRVERITTRDGISHEEAKGRINSQIPDSELIKKADYVIYNNADVEALKEQVSAVVLKINKIKSEDISYVRKNKGTGNA